MLFFALPFHGRPTWFGGLCGLLPRPGLDLPRGQPPERPPVLVSWTHDAACDASSTSQSRTVACSASAKALPALRSCGCRRLYNDWPCHCAPLGLCFVCGRGREGVRVVVRETLYWQWLIGILRLFSSNDLCALTVVQLRGRLGLEH